MSKKQKKNVADLPLFDMLRDKAVPSVVVDQWLDSHPANPQLALCELVNLVLAVCSSSTHCQAAGSTKTVKESDLDNDEGIAQEIADSSRSPGDDGPPLASIKRFDKVFEEFWMKLIKKAQPKKILTADFLSLLGYWLAVISGCPSRAFRHTGTFTALRVITALNDILAQQQKELASTELQIQAEGKHGKTARLNTLKTKATRLGDAMGSLSAAMLDTFFKGVFTQRFRDLEADIRALCIESLGTWIHRNPQVWLEDEYVKYLGWDAHDHDASTRLATLKGIERILADESNWEKMTMFSERFRERFVSATLDKDSACAVTAIKICEHLLRAGIMQQADIDTVCSLTSDKDAKIRQAAGSFVFQHVFVGLLGSKTDASLEPAPKQKKRELTALVEFVLKISFIDLPNYLVEALWGRLYVLTDWEAQVTSLKESADNQAQQTALAQTLLCCIKRALGFSITPSTKQVKPAAGESQAISKYFMEHLPELLEFFRTEDHVLIELVEIPRYLDLEGYKTYHLETKFAPLLQSLGAIFAKATSKNLIEAIGGSLQILLSDHPLKKQTEKAVTTLAQKLNTHLSKSHKDKTTVWTLQKVGTLLLIYDLTDFGFPEHAINALQVGKKASKEERRVLINSALRVLWLDAVHSVNLLAEQKQPTTASIAVVVEKRERLLGLVEEYLKDIDAGVQLDTFPIAIETLLAFKRGWLNTPLSLIAYSATDALHDALTQCIEENIDRTPEEADSAPAGNEVQQERAELLAMATERQELLISGVDRAIATSNLRRDMAVPILVRYNTFSKSTQALVKRLYHDIRAIYENSEWQVVLATLKRKFEDNNSPALKELARSIASLHGVEVVGKVQRASLISLIRNGIDWVFASEEDRFDFLEDALHPFVAKLVVEDIAGFVVPHWEKQVAKFEEEPDHPSFNLFASYLEAAKAGHKSKGRPKTPLKKKLALGAPPSVSRALNFAETPKSPKARGRVRKPNHEEPPASLDEPVLRRRSQPDYDEEDEEEEQGVRGRSKSPKRGSKGNAKPKAPAKAKGKGKGKGKGKAAKKGKKAQSSSEPEDPVSVSLSESE